jgi:hypothetical protein
VGRLDKKGRAQSRSSCTTGCLFNNLVSRLGDEVAWFWYLWISCLRLVFMAQGQPHNQNRTSVLAACGQPPQLDSSTPPSRHHASTTTKLCLPAKSHHHAHRASSAPLRSTSKGALRLCYSRLHYLDDSGSGGDGGEYLRVPWAVGQDERCIWAPSAIRLRSHLSSNDKFTNVFDRLESLYLRVLLRNFRLGRRDCASRTTNETPFGQSGRPNKRLRTKSYQLQSWRTIIPPSRALRSRRWRRFSSV